MDTVEISAATRAAHWPAVALLLDAVGRRLPDVTFAEGYRLLEIIEVTLKFYRLVCAFQPVESGCVGVGVAADRDGRVRHSLLAQRKRYGLTVQQLQTLDVHELWQVSTRADLINELLPLYRLP